MTTLQTTLPVATTVTASGALTAGKHTPADATSGALTLTLPTPVTVGARLRVEKIDAGTNTVTISGTIRSSATTIVLTSQYHTIELVAESLTSWRPASDHRTISGIANDPAVKAAIDAEITAQGALTPDATPTVKGKVQLAGDLGGTAASPTVPGLAGKLSAASNLSDLANAATARTNLGLGTAATQAATAFDTAGAASAAQTASLQKTANLSDLSSAATARTNLGLGTAATQPSTAFAPLRFFDVKLYGAVGDGTTDDTTAIAAAVTAASVTGGVVHFPPASYVGAVSVTANVPILVLGYGATLKPAADNVDLLKVSQGNGINIRGARFEGFVLDGSGHAGVTGLHFQDTDGSAARDLHIRNCATGINFTNVASGAWCERNAVYDTFIYSGTTGISFTKSGISMDSFNECALYNVSINAGTTGIYMGPGANMVRTNFENVTLWLGGASQTALVLDGIYFRNTRWNINIEALPGSTTATGINIASALTGGQPDSNDIRLSFVGTFANQIVDTAGSTDFSWRTGSGTFWRLNGNSSAVKSYQYGEAFPRLQFYPGGAGTVAFGDGTSSPVRNLACGFGGDFLTWTGSFQPAKGMTPRVVAMTDAATVTPNCGTADVATLATLSQASTVANPTGTKVDGQEITLRIKSAAAQTLTWGTQYRAGTSPTLPATTTGSAKTDFLRFQYNNADTKWDLVFSSLGH